MADPLGSLRHWIQGPGDAIRWACLLEATAPKAGNVYPGRDFRDLRHADFVTAAEITSTHLTTPGLCISRRMLACVQATASQTRTNVNLGIVLLLGPLVAAEENMADPGRTAAHWIGGIAAVLDGFSGDDGRHLYAAIGLASAGGLGRVDHMDVHASEGPVDIVSAMKLAQDRDRIARQYVGNFADLMHQIVPTVARAIGESGDMLIGISRAHVRLLAAEPDSLIARKNGLPVAIDVQTRAGEIDVRDAAAMADWDRSLRRDDHALNPGTTADLIAAALYVLLRSPSWTLEESS